MQSRARIVALLIAASHACGVPVFAQAVPTEDGRVCWPEAEAAPLVEAFILRKPLEERIRLLDQRLVLEHERGASLELSASEYRAAYQSESRTRVTIERRLSRARAPWRHPLVWLSIGAVLSLGIAGAVVAR